MKTRIICAVMIILVAVCLTGCGTLGKETNSVGIFENFLNSIRVQLFLASHSRNLTEDTEAYDYANEFLRLALKKDTDSMKKLFAPKAIVEIGEQELDEMLDAFIDYFQVESFELKMDIGPVTAGHIDHGKRSKELEGPLEITTDKEAFRFAIRCVAYDDWDSDNIGIWSVYIIERDKDTDLEHPYIGDKKYRSGIYIDVKRPD